MILLFQPLILENGCNCKCQNVAEYMASLFFWFHDCFLRPVSWFFGGSSLVAGLFSAWENDTCCKNGVITVIEKGSSLWRLDWSLLSCLSGYGKKLQMFHYQRFWILVGGGALEAGGQLQRSRLTNYYLVEMERSSCNVNVEILKLWRNICGDRDLSKFWVGPEYVDLLAAINSSGWRRWTYSMGAVLGERTASRAGDGNRDMVVALERSSVEGRSFVEAVRGEAGL